MKLKKEVSSRYSKGFTIVELLVVVAIIGILASVVMAITSGYRIKSKSAAFKSEINSLQKSFNVACATDIITNNDIQNGKTFNKSIIDVALQSCGLSGSGTFSFSIPSTNGAGCTSAIVTESKVTFLPAGC